MRCISSAPARPGAAHAPAPSRSLPRAPPARRLLAQTWIFFFDLNHLTPGGGFDRARKAVEDFIRDRFKEGDVGGMLAGDKMINNRLTSVRQELLDAVKQVKPRSDARTRFIELTREWPRLLDEEEALRIARNEREPLQRAVAPRLQRRSGAVPDRPTAAVRQKGAEAGSEIHRASLADADGVECAGVWAGADARARRRSCFSATGSSRRRSRPRCASSSARPARAGARVYAIDVRGLNRGGGAGIIDQAQVEDPAGPASQFDSVADGSEQPRGRYRRHDDPQREQHRPRARTDRRRCGTATTCSAYQPANASFDGKFRAIQVRVKRDGLRVRARRGYLALPASSMLSPQPVKPPTDSETTAPASRDTCPPFPPRRCLCSRWTRCRPPAAERSCLRRRRQSGDATVSRAVRLRPDTEGRVKELSSRDTIASSRAVAQGLGRLPARRCRDRRSGVRESRRRAGRPAVGALRARHVAGGPGPRRRTRSVRGSACAQAVPDFEPVYMDLADTYAQVSDLTRALAVVRDAEKRWPQSADVQSAIGVIHVRRGALDDGIDALVRAATLAPDDALVHLNLGRALRSAVPSRPPLRHQPAPLGRARGGSHQGDRRLPQVRGARRPLRAAGQRGDGIAGVVEDARLSASTRVRFVLALAICSLAIAGLTTSEGRPAQSDRPNVLLVTLDTMRADRIGAYGYTRAETPNLDRLAREGVRFTDATSQSPLTAPAHAAMLTGQYPGRLGIRNNAATPIPSKPTTLAESLKAGRLPDRRVHRRLRRRSRLRVRPGLRRVRCRVRRFPPGDQGAGAAARARVVDPALAWIAATATDRSSRGSTCTTRMRRTRRRRRSARSSQTRPYDGEIAYVDAQVGRMISALRAAGALDRTVVAVIGDHGEALGDHGEEDHGIFLYEAVMRIPWIMRLPSSFRMKAEAAGPEGRSCRTRSGRSI